MRTPRLLITALLAMLALTSVAATSAAPESTWIVEHYYTAETWHAFADIGSKGAGPDDIYAAQQSLKTPNGHLVGIVNGYGVNLHPPYVFFHWTATLNNGTGTLTVESAINTHNKTTTYPIEGGTGRYAGARGTVALTNAGDKGTLATVRYQK